MLSTLSTMPASATFDVSVMPTSNLDSSATMQVINSQHQTYIVDRNYDCWSSLYARGNYRYDSAVYVTADSTFSSYTVGIAPRMYNASNQIISGNTGFQYNTTAGNSFMAFTSTVYGLGNSVQVGGNIAIYDGTGYIDLSVPKASSIR